MKLDFLKSAVCRIVKVITFIKERRFFFFFLRNKREEIKFYVGNKCLCPASTRNGINLDVKERRVKKTHNLKVLG